jgi:hypothetical protein
VVALLYGSSSFEPPGPTIASNPAAGFIVRRFGSQWFVSMCTPSGELQVLLAIPAYGRGMEIVNGELRVDPIGEEWFHAIGLPKGAKSGIVSPEEAAASAARAAGNRVAAVPELVVPPPNQGRVFDARWRIEMDSAAIMKDARSGAELTARELYVRDDRGRDPAPLAVASASQPIEISIRYATNNRVGRPAAEPDVYATVTLRRRSAIAVQFTPVGTALTSGTTLCPSELLRRLSPISS